MPANGFVPTLTRELRARLNELELERLAIMRALQALEPSPPRRLRRSLDEALLQRLRTSPGSRGSLLALELGVDAGVVTSALERLQENGEVTRVGMRWQIAGTSVRQT